MNVPNLSADRCDELAIQLNSARRALGAARLDGDPAAEAMAHARLHTVKMALGRGGASWWEDAA